jgi:hypothetical protein
MLNENHDCMKHGRHGAMVGLSSLSVGVLFVCEHFLGSAARDKHPNEYVFERVSVCSLRVKLDVK